MSVFLTFLKKTAKERWHFLASRMGDCVGYLETPLPLPAESVPNFLGFMVYQFFLLMELRWRASRAEAPL